MVGRKGEGRERRGGAEYYHVASLYTERASKYMEEKAGNMKMPVKTGQEIMPSSG